MELAKNIFFNTDRLIENSKVKISYTGSLFQDGSEDVYIHYGFDNEWKDLNDAKMVKTDLGFQVELFLPAYQTLNFCFRNNNNEWDNNTNTNYSFQIEKIDLSLVPKEDAGVLTYKRKLKKSYIWGKKIKLAVYKFLRYFPRVISKNNKAIGNVSEQ